MNNILKCILSTSILYSNLFSSSNKQQKKVTFSTTVDIIRISSCNEYDEAKIDSNIFAITESHKLTFDERSIAFTICYNQEESTKMKYPDDKALVDKAHAIAQSEDVKNHLTKETYIHTNVELEKKRDQVSKQITTRQAEQDPNATSEVNCCCTIS